VGIDDGAADGQSQSHTLRLGGKKWLKEARHVIECNASALVNDGHLNSVAIPLRFDVKPAMFGISHSVAAIQNQIKQHLLQQYPVTNNGRQL
jgi:hypothetical protein